MRPFDCKSKIKTISLVQVTLKYYLIYKIELFKKQESEFTYANDIFLYDRVKLFQERGILPIQF